MKTLFITASKGLYGLKMKVKGRRSSNSINPTKSLEMVVRCIIGHCRRG